MRIQFGFFVQQLLGTGIYDPNEFREATISEWKVKAGDTVAIGDPLVEVETDKVTMDLVSLVAGKIISIDFEEKELWRNGGIEGTPLGDLVIPALGVIETKSTNDSPPDPAPKEERKPSSLPSSRIRVSPLAREALERFNIRIEDLLSSLPAGNEEITLEDVERFVSSRSGENAKDVSRESHGFKAVPRARSRARELGIDLATVVPHEGNVIRVRDVEAAAAERDREKEQLVPRSSPSAEDLSGYEELTDLGAQRATARHMEEAWATPHASPAIDIDPLPLFTLKDELKEEFQKRHDLILRIDHFFVAASAYLLARPEFRILNAYWHRENGEERIRLYANVNIGIAVGVPPEKTKTGFSGLVTPSLKHADRLSFVEIVREAERLIREAREGKSKLTDLLHITFIVNNTGTPVEWEGKRFSGDEYPDPIIAPKTAAILAFGAPRSGDDSGRQLMNVKLRFDHRVVNGYEPKLFLRALQDLIENPERVLVLK